ncbi:hypothetical protein [Actinokineospora sp. NBRC 105648]|uniref:hypothetical protein n=1 Tax=Actinokineospora sp. NBRC 105648 TaxID=3032206 RepID=UPI0024A133B8|nr:hypothetical protein [Actinokineospora sp. NBRC 105648]GLZ37356.1 hypothetical protein Acsp05_09810 [Actinokineospora sp. NBRC 105648]
MTEQTTAQPGGEPQQPGAWGAPAAERPQARWSWKKTAATTAVAVGIATAGGFAVYAASGATADTTNGRGGPGMGGGPGGMGGPGGGAGGLQGALHGEFVVSDGNGGYANRVMQTGEVTALSDTSITAKSTDGYTKTYTIDADTVKSSIQTGDTVTVIATPSGDTATADSVSERGTGGQGGAAPGGVPQNGQQGVPPRREDSSGSDSTQPTG